MHYTVNAAATACQLQAAFRGLHPGLTPAEKKERSKAAVALEPHEEAAAQRSDQVALSLGHSPGYFAVNHFA